MNHRWTNRIFPPLVVVAVVGGVWYAATHRTEDTPITAASSSTASTVTNAKPVETVEATTEPLATPLVEKLPGKVKFTVNTPKVAKVQKVEFYVSSRLVGAAYSEPYTVSVDETILQPGTHQVVAKVYTASVTKDTPPTDFTSSVPAGTKPSSDAIAVTPPTPAPSPSSSGNNQSQPVTPTPPPTPIPTTVSPPTGLAATAGTAAQPVIALSWDAPTDSSAVSYQVWRGGVLLASGITATSYADNTIEAAQTYYYQVISIGNDGGSSDPSNTASATYYSPSVAAPNPGG